MNGGSLTMAASFSALIARRRLLLLLHLRSSAPSLSLLPSSSYQSPSSSSSSPPLNTITNPPINSLWQQRQPYIFTRSVWRQSGDGGEEDKDGDDDDERGGFIRERGLDDELVVRQRSGAVPFRALEKTKEDVFAVFEGEDEEEESEGGGGEEDEEDPGRSEQSEQDVFGEQLARAGLTEKDLDSLIAKMDFSNIQGLPPLEEILQYDPKSEQKAKRREMEMRKQKELAMSRVRRVDERGRAYATGRRKTSVARVWLFPGAGTILINGKTHNTYFPSLDHRVQLLEPFWETKTLGRFSVYSTVKGGGITGQAGALRLGISRALQFFRPELRSPLRANGMLTRDPRSVERKKPGKAKARKSYQWVKR